MDKIDTLVEVTLPEPDNFLKVKETLTRIGPASNKDKTLYQSCHILHKRGKYYITHFKEMFMLDGKADELSEDDTARRNAIVKLLQDWGLVKVVDPAKIASPISPISNIKVLRHSDKGEWTLQPKYTIGKKVRQVEEEAE